MAREQELVGGTRSGAAADMTNAERLIRTLYKLTEGQLGQWRMIDSLGKVGTAGAVDTAMRAGWIDLEGGYLVRLTEQGWQRATIVGK